MPKKTAQPDDLSRFREFFKKARAEHSRLEDNPESGEAHRAALAFAHNHGWDWGSRFLRASAYSLRKSTADEAIRILNGLGRIDGLEGHIDFIYGTAQRIKGDLDSAIQSYSRALNTPSYDATSNVLNNLGNVYRDKGDVDQAIECYRKALSTPGGDALGRTLNNLGLVYIDKGDVDLAIECYRKALDTPGYDTPYRARNNLAWALREAGQYDEAKREVDRVLAEPDRDEQHSRARYILDLIQRELRDIKPTVGEKALAADPPSDKFAARMQVILQDKTTKYDDYIALYKSDSTERLRDELVILRGWSSSVTLLEGANDRKWPGGGYFLRWRGKGLVIDPGFDFLDNFHEDGHHVLDVHAVAVSHDHPDHNGDLRSLDDLCYETHRNGNNPRPNNERKTLFMVDLDSYKRIPNPTSDHRGTLCTFNKRDAEDGQWFGGERNGLPFHIEHFPVTHSTDVPEAQGFRVVLENEDRSQHLVIGYTGDTKYCSELVEKLADVDVLLAHVSQPSPRELIDEKYFKEDHLGYNGVTELVRSVKPKLTLIGEFWAGLADLRLEIVGGVRNRTGVSAVLPACLGLRINLPDLTIRCTKCGKGTRVDSIKVAPPTSPFGDLGYLCPECIL